MIHPPLTLQNLAQAKLLQQSGVKASLIRSHSAPFHYFDDAFARAQSNPLLHTHRLYKLVTPSGEFDPQGRVFYMGGSLDNQRALLCRTRTNTLILSTDPSLVVDASSPVALMCVLSVDEQSMDTATHDGTPSRDELER